MGLNTKSCVPCKGGVPPLSVADANVLKQAETPLWKCVDGSTKLYRKFTFKSFVSAEAFVMKVGEVAESENHHPDIRFGWGYAEIFIQTHKINGLHKNDFILAAKIDRITV